MSVSLIIRCRMVARKLLPHPPESAQECTLFALRRLIYRIGVKESAALLDVNESNIRRRFETGHLSAWGAGDLISLKKRERDEFGTRELQDAEELAIYGTTPASPISIRQDLGREISEDATIILRANAILDDGVIDRRDLAELEALDRDLQTQVEHRQELCRSVKAAIAQLKGGGARV